MRSKRKFIVCDYPNPLNYTFPNFSLGSTEKRLWQIAKTVSDFNDFEVIITGPLWLPRYLPKAQHFVKRLDATTAGEFFKLFGKADYLFAGSEYFNKAEYTKAFFKVSHKIMTYVSHIYDFGKRCFNRKNSFLFCYSNEMLRRHRIQQPYKLLLFHSGVGEVPYLTKKPKKYLLWIGRIDEDKSPHYAVLAAKKLKIPIYILGRTVMQPNYEKKYSKLFNSPLVKKFGVVAGDEKMKLISNSLCGIYTCGPKFIEAAAGTLGEILCSGVPVAGISWKGDDAICEAVNSKKLGLVFLANNDMDENQIVNGLTGAIKRSLELDKMAIYEIANYRYDMGRLMREMFFLADNS